MPCEKMMYSIISAIDWELCYQGDFESCLSYLSKHALRACKMGLIIIGSERFYKIQELRHKTGV